MKFFQFQRRAAKPAPALDRYFLPVRREVEVQDGSGRRVTLEYTSDKVYSVDARGTRRRLKQVNGGFVVTEGKQK